MVLARVAFDPMAPAVELRDRIALFLLSVMPTLGIKGNELPSGSYVDKTEDALALTNEGWKGNWAIPVSCAAMARSFLICGVDGRGGSAPKDVGSCCYAQAWLLINANSLGKKLTEATWLRHDRKGDLGSSLYFWVRIRAILHAFDELWEK